METPPDPLFVDCAVLCDMQLACVGGHLDCIRLLVDNGASKKARNRLQETPWECLGISCRTPEGRRIAKVMGMWKETDSRQNTPKKND